MQVKNIRIPHLNKFTRFPALYESVFTSSLKFKRKMRGSHLVKKCELVDFKFKACYWSYIRVQRNFGSCWFKVGGLSLIVCSVPALKVGGEVCPGWVELAQLVGKKNVWLVACRRKIYIFFLKPLESTCRNI